MTRLASLLSLLVILSLACSASAAVPVEISDPQPEAKISAPPKSELQQTPDGKYPYSATVTASKSLYVRNGAYHTYEIVGHLLHGASVTVYECVDGWARIGAEQFVNSAYLSKGCEK